MCGLISLIAKRDVGFFNKHADIVQQMLYADAVRGWDATGLFGITKEGNVDIVKRAAPPSLFFQTPEYQEFHKKIVSKYHFVIGHNRKATHGEKRNQDAHPFWDKENNICLVHNGMISNHKEFCKEATVDSAALCNALADSNDVANTISEITGAYALIWYNVEEKKLYFVRNHARPLFLCESEDALYLVSEESLAYWIAKRNNNPITESKELEVNALYSIDLDTKNVVEEKKIEKKAWQRTEDASAIYIPSTTQTTTTRYTGTTKTQRHLGAIKDAFFLTRDDLNTPGKIMQTLKTGMKILVNPMEYVLPKYPRMSHLILCELVNIGEIANLDIRAFVNKDEFDAIDLTKIHSARIKHLTCVMNELTLYIELLEPESVITSFNNIEVTTEMWTDDRFPCECDGCQSKITYHGLDGVTIDMEDNKVVSLFCGPCMEGG